MALVHIYRIISLEVILPASFIKIEEEEEDEEEEEEEEEEEKRKKKWSSCEYFFVSVLIYLAFYTK